MIDKICLGTAQFGIDYGVTNRKGAIAIEEIKNILSFAKKSGICYLDTAKDYGNSERAIGRSFADKLGFKLITKYSFKKACESDSIKDYLKRCLSQSLDNTLYDSLYAVLSHDKVDITTEKGQEFFATLLSLKESGYIKNIGLSIYNKNEIESIPLDIIDIIQLPLSIFDQRNLNDNFLKKLKKRNIEIHVRSIFLQGIALTDDISSFDFLTSDFKEHHNDVSEHFKKNNIEMHQACLSFCDSIPEIDNIIVGVYGINDLIQLVNSINKAPVNENWNKFSWENPKDIDPRLWC